MEFEREETEHQKQRQLKPLSIPMPIIIPATGAPATVFSRYNHNRGRTNSIAVISSDRLLSSVQIRFRKNKREFALSPVVFSAMSNSSGTTDASIEDMTNKLKEVHVYDINGNATSVIDLWRDRKAVVAFARHFGCVLCRKRADLLASNKDSMDAAGVALALIGPGNVDQARAFAEQTKFKGEVYADPNHSSFDALSFVSGITTTFTPLAGMKILQLYMEGYRQDWGLSFEKDTVSKGGWQQGGILVAGPGISNITYLHRDKEAGDDPDVQDVLKACCK